MPESDLDHEHESSTEEQTHKTEPPYPADINLLEHPLEAELCEDSDKRDLEVFQCKDKLFPRGLSPLE